MTKQAKNQDLIIVGGGIMGLMTAYWASSFTKNITIIEKQEIGNNEAASFSFTRSMRTDYLDPIYVRFALEAQRFWRELEQQSSEPLFINNGVLNIAKQSITPNLATSYAEKSNFVLQKLNAGPESFSKARLEKRFPQFNADIGYLDTRGGYLKQQPTAKLLLKLLRDRGITFVESCTTVSIEEKENLVSLATDKGDFTGNKLVITAGVWANDILAIIKNNIRTFPITPAKRKECRYYYPTPSTEEWFLPEKFPVFAYLDIGIYGHPIFDKEKGAVKISYYPQPDATSTDTGIISSISDFVQECLPMLRDARSEPVEDADQCFYDFVADDNFILGKLPDFDRIVVGAGWRGTGYKFSPWAGKVLAELALKGDTIYDITTFNPGRFKNNETSN